MASISIIIEPETVSTSKSLYLVFISNELTSETIINRAIASQNNNSDNLQHVLFLGLLINILNRTLTMQCYLLMQYFITRYSGKSHLVKNRFSKQYRFSKD